MKSGGYWGKILRIDLSSGKTNTYTDTKYLTDGIARKYIGGSGLGARILYDETTPETDPLGPENPLIFAVGPLTGTRVFNSNRFQVVARSPLTGIYGEANCGGFWGEVFKNCGYDAMVIHGQARKPVYLYIDDDEVRIEDAASLWSKETFEVDRYFKDTFGKPTETAVIGPAGENLVKISNIVTDGVHGRAVGRCGMGALMGSKKLKAIVVRGNRHVPVAHEDGIKDLMKKLGPLMNEGIALALRKYGTSGGVEYCEEIGNLPIRNWFQGPWPEGAKKISGQAMADSILTDNYHCGRCVISCGRTVKAKGGPYDGMEVGGPEYETIGLLGSNLMIDDLSVIAKSNELCNRLGLDTISTGGVIGFAMEAFERGLITEKDTGRISLKWGDGKAVHALIEKIARREDLGDVLAEGVAAAAEQIGGVAREFAVHVKGLEPPAHDPRAKMTVAVGFATSNRGACHLQAFTHDFEEGAVIDDLGSPGLTDRFTLEGKAENVFRMQNLMSMFDSLTACKFSLFGGMTVKPLADFVSQVTGWDFDEEEFMKTGDRLYCLKRMYNVRLGLSRKDDTLPPRMLVHKRGGGTNELPAINVMLNEYYRYRGWDEFGIPTRERLSELGLDGEL
jgi:aldehyde:ferredoxin oxidoreductase